MCKEDDYYLEYENVQFENSKSKTRFLAYKNSFKSRFENEEYKNIIYNYKKDLKYSCVESQKIYLSALPGICACLVALLSIMITIIVAVNSFSYSDSNKYLVYYLQLMVGVISLVSVLIVYWMRKIKSQMVDVLLEYRAIKSADEYRNFKV